MPFNTTLNRSDASCLSLHAKYCDLSLQDRKTHPSLRNWYCFEDSVEVEVAELRKIWAKLIFVVRRSKILGNRQLQRRTRYTKECTLPYSAHPILSVPLLKISWGYLVEYLHNLSTPSWLWKSHSLNIHRLSHLGVFRVIFALWLLKYVLTILLGWGWFLPL